MSLFGEGFPAIWEVDKNQISTILESQTSVAGQSSVLTFNNAHDYEVGMYLHVKIIKGVYIDIYANVTNVTPLQVTIDYDVGNNVDLDLGEATGYIALVHATYDSPEYIDKEQINKKSPITRKKKVITLGHYTNFVFTLNLLRYTDSVRDALAKLLYKVDAADVYFYPHIDKEKIQKKDGGDATFNFNFSPYYLSEIDFRDRATIIISSNDLTDLTNNIGA